MTERLSDEAIAALERGEPVRVLEARQVPVEGSYCAVQACDQFWLWCAEALRRAVNQPDAEDGLRCTHILLCETLHIKPE